MVTGCFPNHVGASLPTLLGLLLRLAAVNANMVWASATADDNTSFWNATITTTGATSVERGTTPIKSTTANASAGAAPTGTMGVATTTRTMTVSASTSSRRSASTWTSSTHTTSLTTTTTAEMESWASGSCLDCMAEFEVHMLICGASWVSLGLLSLILGTCRQRWDSERVERTLGPLVRFFTSQRHYLVVAMTLSFAMCVLHVLRVEFDVTNDMWLKLEMCAQFVHILETLVLWMHATAKSSADSIQLIAGRFIIDCLVAPSVLYCVIAGKKHFSLSYFASLRFFILLDLLLTASSTRNSVRSQMARGIVGLSCGIFSIGALMKQVETFQGPSPSWALPPDAWTIEASAYFVSLNILTVGYGDLSPRTFLGQVQAALVTLVGMWFLFRTILGVVQALESNRSGNGYYVGKQRTAHIIITGSPSFQVLRDFLVELYLESPASRSENLNVVLLLLPGQRPVMDAMRTFLRQKRNHSFQQRIVIIQGSALRREDLDRVNYKDATAAFLLPNLYTEDAEREDIDNAMRAQSMATYVPFVRIVTLLLRAEHRDLLLSVGIPPGDVVCIDELKHGLLAKSSEVHGFTTLACSLCKCSGGLELDIREAKLPWIQDYLKGFANQVFDVDLCPSYKGAPFGEVSLDVMARSKGRAFLVGIIEEPLFPADRTITIVFPGKHHKVATNDDYICKGIFIATDRSSIAQYPPGTMFPWHMDAEMRAIVAAGGTDAPITLPGAVPEAIASADNSGWVCELRDRKDAHAEKLLKSTEITAAQWSVHGLRQQTQMSLESLHKCIGLPLADDLQGIQDPAGPKGMTTGEGHLSAENDPDFTSDPTQRALLEQRIAEADHAAAATEATAEAKLMFAARKVLALAEDLENRRREVLEPLDRDKEEDKALWGFAPLPSPKAFVGEPWPALLVRGGHVLVLAIDSPMPGSAPEEEEDQAAGAEGKSCRQSFGRKLGIEHFVRSLRAGDSRWQSRRRPIVVVASRVPHDWCRVASESDVYLVLGRPLSSHALHRASLPLAHAVVVHQRGCRPSRDPNMADAEAISACRLAETMAGAAAREITVVCDLHLELNGSFVAYDQHEAEQAQRDEDEERERKSTTEGKPLPYYVQSRFVSGQLFVSSIPVTMAANMLFKPALGHVIFDMLHRQFVVVPVPQDFSGKTFGQLFEHLLTKSNLLPMALLRHRDNQDLEAEAEAEAEADDVPGLLPPPPPERWHPQEPPSKRYVLVMPLGEQLIAERDGVICAVASSGRVVLPPVQPPTSTVAGVGNACGGRSPVPTRGGVGMACADMAWTERGTDGQRCSEPYYACLCKS